MHESVLCILDLSVAPIYLCLGLIAMSSVMIKPLQQLAAHGKTKEGRNGSAASEVGACKPTTQGNIRRIFLQAWNCLLRWNIPKKCFLHFYLVGLGSTSVISIYISCIYGTDLIQCLEYERMIALGLLLVHLIRRCYECLCVHAWTSNSTMHLFGYLLGLLHYALLPLVFIPSSDLYHVHHTRVVSGTTTQGTLWEKRLVIALGALMLGLVGQYEQHLHHVILANLRKKANQMTIANQESSKSSGKIQGNHYAIPNGRGFNYVSCPHYLAEICIYVSFYLLLGHNHTNGLQCQSIVELLQMHQATILLFWVTVNLTISAQGSHQWYNRQTRLQDNKSHTITPAIGSKKAIFPFLF
jgi:3-oxo-5-alpha-steroid 4-dehydrogenase 3